MWGGCFGAKLAKSGCDVRVLVGNDTAVISFQNGVVKDGILMFALGKETVVGWDSCRCPDGPAVVDRHESGHYYLIGAECPPSSGISLPFRT